MSPPSFFVLLIDLAMAICPSLGYMSTAYRIGWMHCFRTLEGYSVFVSYILLTSQAIRILYFVCGLNTTGKTSVAAASTVVEETNPVVAATTATLLEHPTVTAEKELPFSLALLAQSIIMLSTQVVLVLCVLRLYHQRRAESVAVESVASDSPRNSPISTSPIPNSAHSRNPSYQKTLSSVPSFSPSSSGIISPSQVSTTKSIASSIATREGSTSAELPTIQEFLNKAALFVLALVGIALIYPTDHLSPEVLGYIALGVEAMLVAPQLMKNYQRKSCVGVTWELLLSWAGGDVAKFIYFVAKAQPAPFIVCNLFQLALDAVLVFQIATYGW